MLAAAAGIPLATLWVRGRRSPAWETLAQVALKELGPTIVGVQLIYASSERVERVLQQLARLESEYSFARWRVSRRADELVLEVTSGGDGVSAVQALFDAVD